MTINTHHYRDIRPHSGIDITKLLSIVGERIGCGDEVIVQKAIKEYSASIEVTIYPLMPALFLSGLQADSLSMFLIEGVR